MLSNFVVALTLEREHRDDHTLSVLLILPKDYALCTVRGLKNLRRFKFACFV